MGFFWSGFFDGMRLRSNAMGFTWNWHLHGIYMDLHEIEIFDFRICMEFQRDLAFQESIHEIQ